MEARVGGDMAVASALPCAHVEPPSHPLNISEHSSLALVAIRAHQWAEGMNHTCPSDPGFYHRCALMVIEETVGALNWLLVDSYHLNLSLHIYKMETCPLHWDNVYLANKVQYLAHNKGTISQFYRAAAICLWAAPDHILSLLRRFFVPFILLY